MREKYIKYGIKSFRPYEVLELLLHYSIPVRDTKSIAKELIDSFGGLDEVLSASAEQLSKQPGIGNGSATVIKLADEIEDYISSLSCDDVYITSAEDAMRYALDFMADFETPVFCAAVLDRRGQIINSAKLCNEYAGSVDFNISLLTEYVLKFENAAGILIMHNHPGGKARFSASDVLITEQTKTFLSPFGVSVFDHVVTADGEAECYSAYKARI